MEVAFDLERTAGNRDREGAGGTAGEVGAKARRSLFGLGREDDEDADDREPDAGGEPRQRSISSISTPRRRATKAWPSSCRRTPPKSSNALASPSP